MGCTKLTKLEHKKVLESRMVLYHPSSITDQEKVGFWVVHGIWIPYQFRYKMSALDGAMTKRTFFEAFIYYSSPLKIQIVTFLWQWAWNRSPLWGNSEYSCNAKWYSCWNSIDWNPKWDPTENDDKWRRNVALNESVEI